MKQRLILWVHLIFTICPGQSRKYEVLILPLVRNNVNRNHDTRDTNDPVRNMLRSLDNYNNNHDDDDQLGILNKIVGGFEVEINLYPYHASYGNNCGAAIIDKQWALTAAHCGKKSYIRVGSKYLHQGKRVNIKNHVIHPLWGGNNKNHPFDYDFQLLELDETLKFNSNIQPVKIASPDDMVVGKVVTVTGWGNTRENGPYSDVLRAVRVPIIAKENCQKVPFPFFKNSLTPRMFCAGFSEGIKDACQGDSGGPAVADGRLMGTVSFGYGCATPGSFGVYSKLSKVRPWIEETTGLTLDYILGGVSIYVKNAPHSVNYGDRCGGVIIGRRWIITSAHCGFLTFVRFGSSYRLKSPKVPVRRHIVHPLFQAAHEFNYDVQLLEVHRYLHFKKTVGYVPIWGGGAVERVNVSGWGFEKEKDHYTHMLKQVEVQIVPKALCEVVEQFWYNYTLTDEMFCAGNATNDACQGDSGGGATIGLPRHQHLVGIASFGFGCGRVPGVYINTSHPGVSNWIRDVTGIGVTTGGVTKRTF